MFGPLGGRRGRWFSLGGQYGAKNEGLLGQRHDGQGRGAERGIGVLFIRPGNMRLADGLGWSQTNEQLQAKEPLDPGQIPQRG